MGKYYVLDDIEYSRYVDNVHKYKVTIHVDSEGDLPEVKYWWDQGSLAIINNTHESKWLNSNGEWV